MSSAQENVPPIDPQAPVQATASPIEPEKDKSEYNNNIKKKN